MSYFLRDVERLRAQIRDALPEAEITTFDYGFGLNVIVGDRDIVACQPPRDETGQVEVFLTVDQVKQAFESH